MDCPSYVLSRRKEQRKLGLKKVNVDKNNKEEELIHVRKKRTSDGEITTEVKVMRTGPKLVERDVQTEAKPDTTDAESQTEPLSHQLWFKQLVSIESGKIKAFSAICRNDDKVSSTSRRQPPVRTKVKEMVCLNDDHDVISLD